MCASCVESALFLGLRALPETVRELSTMVTIRLTRRGAQESALLSRRGHRQPQAPGWRQPRAGRVISTRWRAARTASSSSIWRASTTGSAWARSSPTGCASSLPATASSTAAAGPGCGCLSRYLGARPHPRAVRPARLGAGLVLHGSAGALLQYRRWRCAAGEASEPSYRLQASGIGRAMRVELGGVADRDARPRPARLRRF